MTEYCCFEDLAIRGVPAAEFSDRLDLYRSEVRHFLAEAIDESVLILGTHFSAMYSTWEQTRELFERLLDWLPAQGVDEWMTFAEYVASRTESARRQS